ncbi:MAG: NAD-dependent epimerase/dehydratase family protein [Candidatus Xenobium sp.]|nr:NAD-dependent epimerase/dehydratase family protein [Burkholderiales bacterium]
MSFLRTAVVTGGAGFIGSHLARRLAGMGCRVLVLDDFRTGSPEALEDCSVEVVRGCVTDADLVRRLTVGAEVVFHLASLVSVPESLALPEESVRINVGGTPESA